MKFASYSKDNELFYGLKTKGGMIALSQEFPDWPTLREVVENNGFKSDLIFIFIFVWGCFL